MENSTMNGIKSIWWDTRIMMGKLHGRRGKYENMRLERIGRLVIDLSGNRYTFYKEVFPYAWDLFLKLPKHKIFLHDKLAGVFERLLTSNCL